MAQFIAAVVDTNQGKVVNTIVANAAQDAHPNGFLLVAVTPVNGASPIDKRWTWSIGLGLVAPVSIDIGGMGLGLGLGVGEEMRQEARKP